MADTTGKVIAAVGLLADLAKCDLFIIEGAGPRKPHLVASLLPRVLKPQNRNHWALIESIVVFEDVLYDRYAFNRFPMKPETRERVAALAGHGLVAADWPVEVYQRTAHKLEQWKQNLICEQLLEAARDVPRDPTQPFAASNDKFWDGAEKDYHDGLFEDGQRARYSFADSDRSADRAFFYSELSRTLGIGMLPRAYVGTEGAESLLDAIGLSYSQCAHHYHVLKHLQPFDEKIRPKKYTAVFPPLAQKIAYLSLATSRTPVEVAIEMRNSPEARAYRRFLGSLQQELQESKPSSPGAITKLLRDLDATVAHWVAEGSAKSRIHLSPRTLSIDWLPVAAMVLEYLRTYDVGSAVNAATVVGAVVLPLPKRTFSFDNPVLWNAPKYLSFVQDWYDYPSS